MENNVIYDNHKTKEHIYHVVFVIQP